jgi:hypothetical protein
LFAAFAPAFKGLLEPAGWLDLQRVYADGTLDPELLRKLSEKDHGLQAMHFKFLTKYGIGVISVPSPMSQSSVLEDPSKWWVTQLAKAAKELATWEAYVFGVWDVPPNSTLPEHAFHNTLHWHIHTTTSLLKRLPPLPPTSGTRVLDAWMLGCLDAWMLVLLVAW